MTDNSSQPMVFEDIHELLRKVNGESESAYMWQSDKNKKEIKSEEPPKAPEKACEETDEESVNSTAGYATGGTDKESFQISFTETVEGKDKGTGKKTEVKSGTKTKNRQGKSPPLPSRTVREKDSEVAEKTREKIPPVTRHSSHLKDDIHSQIESFSYNSEKGHRHWIFLPDDVKATLVTVFGSNRLSAILTALARAYIENNKEELRRLVTDRTNLLQ